MTCLPNLSFAAVVDLAKRLQKRFFPNGTGVISRNRVPKKSRMGISSMMNSPLIVMGGQKTLRIQAGTSPAGLL
jgi:hypothetical protein